jgi:HK97 family phage prohead protease
MTLLAPDMFVKPVEGHDELVAFSYGFVLEPEGKATDTTVTELENGDLLIEGWAADFAGEDREGENFAPGAFERGIKSFLDGQASLCFHHQSDKGIGRVLELREEGKGLYMKARVDAQPESSPLRYIYNAVKKGTYRGLSVGGFFKRAYLEGKRRIADVDFTEISVTPVPVNPNTGFSVIAGKALEGMAPDPVLNEDANQVPAELLEAVEGLKAVVTRLEEAKALPKAHDPQAASILSTFLQTLGAARSFATGAREISDNDALVELANKVESECVRWEADAHKLAAKVGPLPTALGV